MTGKLGELKKKYLREYGCFDREFVDEEEEKEISNMSNQLKRQYMLDNVISLDMDPVSETRNKHYRIQFWDIANEELGLIVQMESAKKISRIYYILMFFLVIWFIGTFLILQWFYW